ncbi:hypothetical protein SG34_011570 [Thalassomonas viridans]|uniref:Uncharacterized protein n=1 Tax=Thalassomonas viridans TaxID=137584 RepID=A0AAF0CB18_9GAMM|nr:hypothetical protein [Thalassomonas viridans]WDE07468.1 hypothetical protein SG34_011570 [Thalassomonas viridans]
MAKSNDMPEFHSVKVSLTENILIPAPRHSLTLPVIYAKTSALASKGGRYHV